MAVKAVVEAVFTVACVAPKKTVLFAGVGLNPVPVMVIEVPTGPLAGVKPATVGCAINSVQASEKAKTKKA